MKNYNEVGEGTTMLSISGSEVKCQVVYPVKFKKLHDDAVIPEYETSGSAGFDLSSVVDETIPPGEQRLIPIGLAVELPEGTELQIRPRSGLAVNNMITVTNSPGTVDSDFRGQLKVILLNLGKKHYHVKQGDRIAQGVLAPYLIASFEVVDDLSNTERGEGGYGHTGR